MVDNKQVDSSKKLVVVLALLSVVVVVLVVLIVLLTPHEKHDGNNGYSGLARDCYEIGDEDAIMECLNDKAFSFYSDENDCEKALKVYDDISEGSLSDRSVAMLYDEAYSLSLSCDDSSLQEYWEEKSERKWEHLEGMN